MTREHTVAVRLKSGAGAVTHCAGSRYDISIKPGEVLTKWNDGSPITRAEFDAVLASTELFEVSEDQPKIAAVVQDSGHREE